MTTMLSGTYGTCFHSPSLVRICSLRQRYGGQSRTVELSRRCDARSPLHDLRKQQGDDAKIAAKVVSRISMSRICLWLGEASYLRVTVQVLLVFELGVDFLRVRNIAHIAEMVLGRSFPAMGLVIARWSVAGGSEAFRRRACSSPWRNSLLAARAAGQTGGGEGRGLASAPCAERWQSRRRKGQGSRTRAIRAAGTPPLSEGTICARARVSASDPSGPHPVLAPLRLTPPNCP